MLVKRDNTERVFCIVRAPSAEAGLSRLETALRDARIRHDISAREFTKIVACPGDLGDPNGRFGLTQAGYEAIQRETTSIIHNAWAVNLYSSLADFEAQSIRPTSQLVNFALGSPLPDKPVFTFVSSIATVLGHRADKILERRYSWEDVVPIGYGQSKWVAEEILAAAVDETGLQVRVARLGQIVGDTKHGRWKTSDSYPTAVQCALTIGALPIMAPSDEKVDDAVHWLPVDTTATAIVDITLHRDGSQGTCGNKAQLAYYCITAAQGSSWSAEIVPMLRDALGMYNVKFEALPHAKWLQRLEDSEPDISLNPPRKMLPFFRIRWPADGQAGGEPPMDMSRAHAVSPSLSHDSGSGMSEEIIHKFVKYWVEECWTKGRTTTSKI